MLRNKDETFRKFSEWKALLENQTSRKVKALRADNGSWFYNEEFDELCRIHGILWHRTVRHTPQQNGDAKRMNITLLDKVTALIFTAKVPKTFWGEALHTATYLVNKSLNRLLGLKCPEEVWSGKPLDLQRLRIFGCVAYAHNKEGMLYISYCSKVCISMISRSVWD